MELTQTLFQSFTQSYASTICALGALALLMFVQLLVADVAGLRAKHVPGATVAVNHDSFLFRASRAVGNVNESIAVFLLAVLFCLFSGASAGSTGYAAWGFVAARTAYALCYYLNLQALRSIAFGISLIALAALLILGAVVWL